MQWNQQNKFPIYYRPAGSLFWVDYTHIYIYIYMYIYIEKNIICWLNNNFKLFSGFFKLYLYMCYLLLIYIYIYIYAIEWNNCKYIYIYIYICHRMTHASNCKWCTPWPWPNFQGWQVQTLTSHKQRELTQRGLMWYL